MGQEGYAFFFSVEVVVFFAGLRGVDDDEPLDTVFFDCVDDGLGHCYCSGGSGADDEDFNAATVDFGDHVFFEYVASSLFPPGYFAADYTDIFSFSDTLVGALGMNFASYDELTPREGLNGPFWIFKEVYHSNNPH